MKPQNLLILFSDEHNPKVLGAGGHPFISTPNLDALAARGTRFTQGSTPCPICVPARASLATGRYNYEIGYWDNADAYEGRVPSWHHLLRAQGHRVVSIGKLHFRGHQGDDHGFSEEIVPMHIVDGLGDLISLRRGPDAPVRAGAKKMIGAAGPGESDYTRYDRDIAAQAQIWLRDEAPKYQDKPWVLFVSMVAPHFPLTAPPEHYYRYANMQLPMPKQYAQAERPRHPHLIDYSSTMNYDAHMKSEADVRRALAGYFGLVSFMDEQVGKVITALQETGLAANTTKPGELAYRVSEPDKGVAWQAGAGTVAAGASRSTPRPRKKSAIAAASCAASSCCTCASPRSSMVVLWQLCGSGASSPRAAIISARRHHTPDKHSSKGRLPEFLASKIA